MKITKTNISGVLIIEPNIFKDERGYFFESYSKREFEKEIGPVNFVQDNESKSSYGVVRGLHFQKGEHSQAKLVRVIEGTVLDVAVDMRKNSPTFGQHVAVELNAEDKKMFFIPRGFAHGFSVLSETAIFQYKCDNFYAPESEGSVAWNDSEIGVDWQVPDEDVILSEKDKNSPLFKDAYYFLSL